MRRREHEPIESRSYTSASIEGRFIPRNRIKCCTIFGPTKATKLPDTISPDLAQALIERDVIEQVGREIAKALLEHGKIWFQYEGVERYRFFASVEVIVPESTYEAAKDHVPPMPIGGLKQRPMPRKPSP